MFLDIVDSTGMAERLGDLRAQALIGHFFFDISAPIAANGGETHWYIGDEVVVTWPWSRALRDAAWVQCVREIHDVIERRAKWYQ
jgi:adenylate cyclase